ncbi:uncharacterized protein UV8b_06215 [Ustilaginoidea virens]|uniref:Uncharacterized protein n=1 Tax=Ustilaginoidea virens TaxID=1159556 RepID=A0A8E5HVH4_USTVR|nr:uncharacterized protein UV8b_06215 [Ustilaginoidea virens]QUC21974.1 hypothetical protein UV8b_06215 [Ustilaginoidea virens]
MSDIIQPSLWNFNGFVLPQSASFIVRSISALSAFIGTIFILPLVFFLIIDIALWLWRHISRPSDVQTWSSSTERTTATSPSADAVKPIKAKNRKEK